MLNKVQLIGNLGRDPEVRQTYSGNLIVNLSIATSERWTDKNTGDKKERTEWHRVVIFNQHIAAVVRDYLKKGSKVYIEGQLATRKWTDDKGQDKYTTEVVLQAFSGELKMLDSGGNSGPGFSGDPDAYGTTTNREQSPLDDEVPY